MPFSLKLTADYTELVNEKLDHIPVDSVDDFPHIISALEAINQNDYSTPKPLLNRVEEIRYMLDNPEDYVQDPADYDEYKEIILKRVSAKIAELMSLSPEAKSNIVDEQKKLKELTSKNLDEMKRRTPPPEGSEAHVENTPPLLQILGMGLLNADFEESTSQSQPQPEPQRELRLDDQFVINLRRAFASTSASRERRETSTGSPSSSQRQSTASEDDFARNLRNAWNQNGT